MRLCAVAFAALAGFVAVTSGSASTAPHWVATDVAAQAKQEFPDFTGVALLEITSDDRLLWTAHAADGVQSNLEVFQWRSGVVTDLGRLPNGMVPTAFNRNGDIAGSDLRLPSGAAGYQFPPVRAFLWKNGRATLLGALGPVGYVSGVNDRDQVVDTGSVGGDARFPPLRSLLWDRGKVTNLGAMGESETGSIAINDAGQVLGEAGAGPNDTGFGFLWERGKATRIGEAGASYAPVAFNDHGLVVGFSEMRAWHGVVHAFVWQGGRPIDLGPAVDGGSPAVDDRGQVIETRSSNQLATRAILWQNSKSTDLGSLGGPRTYPLAIDARGDVAGIGTLRDSTDENQDLRAFVWRGGRMTELPGRLYDSAGPIAIDDSGTHVAAGTGRDECTSNTDCSGQLLLWTYER